MGITFDFIKRAVGRGTRDSRDSLPINDPTA